MAAINAQARAVVSADPAGLMAMRRGGPAPVDLIHLARQTFGSADLEREVLRLFVQQGGGLVRRIADAASANERAEQAHRLKGSARAIGATRVGQLAEVLETAQTSEVAALARDLGEAVAEVERFVADILGPHA